jgi:hypothetical protein
VRTLEKRKVEFGTKKYPFSEVRGSKRPVERGGKHPRAACRNPFGVEMWAIK